MMSHCNHTLMLNALRNSRGASFILSARDELLCLISADLKHTFPGRSWEVTCGSSIVPYPVCSPWIGDVLSAEPFLYSVLRVGAKYIFSSFSRESKVSIGEMDPLCQIERSSRLIRPSYPEGSLRHDNTAPFHRSSFCMKERTQMRSK